MGAEKTFYQRLFRVPVAPVGTSINEQDDSWLRSPEDPTRSKDRDGDGYTHPYDQERKAKAKGKSPDREASSQPKKSMWQRMKEEEEERKSRGPSPIGNADASLNQRPPARRPGAAGVGSLATGGS